MNWLTPTGAYYEGDRVSALDIAVPPRPDPTYDWLNGAWVQNAARLALVTTAAQVATDDTAVRTTNIVQQLMNATDAQIATFVANHSAADAGTQQLLVLLARICRVILNKGVA